MNFPLSLPGNLPRKKQIGFSLIELLVSVAVIVLMLVMLTELSSNIQKNFSSTVAKSEQFRAARAALEAITWRLSQATLNTTWEYDNPNNPTSYLRSSDLRFETGPTDTLLSGSSTQFPSHAVFFQAPGVLLKNPVNSNSYQPNSRLEELLNTMGFFVEYKSDSGYRPPFLGSLVPARKRYRLMALVEPSEDFLHTMNHSSSKLWFQQSATSRARVLADNVVGIVFWPRLSRRDDPSGTQLTTNYAYNSAPSGALALSQSVRENQLPPVVTVTLVAIDEKSAARLAQQYSSAPPVWESNWFTNVSQYDSDIQKVKDRLSGADGVITVPVEYRIFTADVPLRASRWSK
jgi:uncharacterized protein (TIGR02599 family)